jgi:hypothetical protein
LLVDPGNEVGDLVRTVHLTSTRGTALVELPDLEQAMEHWDRMETFDLAFIVIPEEGRVAALNFVRHIRLAFSFTPPIYLLEPNLDPCFIAEAVAAGAEGVLPSSDHGALASAVQELVHIHLDATGFV